MQRIVGIGLSEHAAFVVDQKGFGTAGTDVDS